MVVPDLDFPLKLTVKLPWTGGEAVSVLTTDTTPPATTWESDTLCCYMYIHVGNTSEVKKQKQKNSVNKLSYVGGGDRV